MQTHVADLSSCYRNPEERHLKLTGSGQGRHPKGNGTLNQEVLKQASRVTCGLLKRSLCCSEACLKGTQVASQEARALTQAEGNVLWSRIKAGEMEQKR